MEARVPPRSIWMPPWPTKGASSRDLAASPPPEQAHVGRENQVEPGLAGKGLQDRPAPDGPGTERRQEVRVVQHRRTRLCEQRRQRQSQLIDQVEFRIADHGAAVRLHQAARDHPVALLGACGKDQVELAEPRLERPRAVACPVLGVDKPRADPQATQRRGGAFRRDDHVVGGQRAGIGGQHGKLRRTAVVHPDRAQPARPQQPPPHGSSAIRRSGNRFGGGIAL